MHNTQKGPDRLHNPTPYMDPGTPLWFRPYSDWTLSIVAPHKYFTVVFYKNYGKKSDPSLFLQSLQCSSAFFWRCGITALDQLALGQRPPFEGSSFPSFSWPGQWVGRWQRQFHIFLSPSWQLSKLPQSMSPMELSGTHENRCTAIFINWWQAACPWSFRPCPTVS